MRERTKAVGAMVIVLWVRRLRLRGASLARGAGKAARESRERRARDSRVAEADGAAMTEMQEARACASSD